jgi:hypothetical protein
MNVPGEQDLADISIDAPEGFVPQLVDAVPDEADVADFDLGADE